MKIAGAMVACYYIHIHTYRRKKNRSQLSCTWYTWYTNAYVKSARGVLFKQLRRDGV